MKQRIQSPNLKSRPLLPLSLFLLAMTVCGCHDIFPLSRYARLNFYNYTDEQITLLYFDMYDDWIPSEERDTSLNQFRGDIGKLAVRSNDKRSVVVARSFDEWFGFSPNPDTIRIFVVVDYESSEWQQVVEENRVLVRYDLTAYDIERLREGRFLTLSYPPDESMKDIKMWPPYEELVQE